MAGRSAEKEKVRIISAVSRYLDRAEQDRTLPLTFEAIAADAGISRGHFAKARYDTDYEALVARVVALRRRGLDNPALARSVMTGAAERPSIDLLRAQSAAAHGQESGRDLSDEHLATRIDFELQTAVAVMGRWMAYAARSEGGKDAVLLVQDLGKAIGALHACHARLQPLAREREDRLLAEM
jgi:hypothetical protein